MFVKSQLPEREQRVVNGMKNVTNLDVTPVLTSENLEMYIAQETSIGTKKFRNESFFLLNFIHIHRNKTHVSYPH